MFVVDGNASTYAAVFSKPAAISCSLMMFYRSSMLRVLCPLIRMATAGSRPARIMLLTALLLRESLHCTASSYATPVQNAENARRPAISQVLSRTHQVSGVTTTHGVGVLLQRPGGRRVYRKCCHPPIPMASPPPVAVLTR